MNDKEIADLYCHCSRGEVEHHTVDIVEPCGCCSYEVWVCQWCGEERE